MKAFPSFTHLASALVLVASACSSAPPATKSPPDPSGGAPTGPGATVGGAKIDPSVPPTVDEAIRFVAETNDALMKIWVQEQRAAWINENFITDDTDALSTDAKEASLAFVAQKIKEATRYDGLKGLTPDVARQLKLLKLASLMPAPSDPKERGELAQVQVGMQSTYGKGKYCSEKLKKYAAKDAKDNCLTLGDLSKVLEKSKSWDEQLEAWKGWRTVSPPMRKSYERFVELSNKGAREIGFKDTGELWRSGYDMTPAEFEADAERLYNEVKPLYEELHCYVRAKLRKQYGKDKIGDKAPIPAHVLGNMWAQTWGTIYPSLEPYPGQASLDVTAGLKKAKYDHKKMIEGGFGNRQFKILGSEFIDELRQYVLSQNLLQRFSRQFRETDDPRKPANQFRQEAELLKRADLIQR